jgi:transposase-like protein
MKVDSLHDFLSNTDLTCPECSSTLKLMHTDYSLIGKDFEIDQLFHCENCHRDWEQVSSYALKSCELTRKFWG